MFMGRQIFPNGLGRVGLTGCARTNRGGVHQYFHQLLFKLIELGTNHGIQIDRPMRRCGACAILLCQEIILNDLISLDLGSKETGSPRGVQPS